MHALVLENGSLSLRTDRNPPAPRDGWAIIRVTKAGLCNTDLELARGYMDFNGTLGHEFVGVVDACGDTAWIGKRVVGEINAACGTCAWCKQDMGRHCPNRTVLGILGLDGCMAEYCSLPVSNLREVPASLSDDQAVFVEPLSAAFEILEQIDVDSNQTCVVLGDGKLGILCAWALATVSESVMLVGRHAEKLERAQWNQVKTTTSAAEVPPAHIVVDATGSPDGLAQALSLCLPRGTIVLKSTIAANWQIDLTPIVINEINLLGSRCGRFEDGLAGLTEHGIPVERLIDAHYPLAQAPAAFEHAGRKGTLKIVLDMAKRSTADQ